MTKRTRAATAAALPADGPDRRTLLTSGAAAALIASTARALPAVDPDALLLQLRQPWRQTLDAYEAALKAMDAADERAMERWPSYPTFDAWPGDFASFQVEHARITAARDAISAEEGGSAARRIERKTMRANTAVVDRIAGTPARTLRGLAFKVEVSADWLHDRDDLRDGIMADVAAFAAAHPGLCL